MKKTLLFLLFISLAVVIQSCKKDSSSITTTTTDAPGVTQAYIDGTLWAPDTLKTTITYNSSTKTKTLVFTGTKSQKQVIFSVALSSATNDNSFPLGTYKVGSTNNVAMSYYTQQKLANGTYGFVLVGTAQPSAGTVSITSIDTTNKTITGTFNFNATTVTYDANGQIVSTEVHLISSGSLSILPYTYTTN
ncbi:hypothetical protein HH214_18650 [Mucilaginibacter robiniae]|uniref:Uncharacterized protein n=1 Tax=Mucilaginibacter robiniae TaxID=2728022 RepID=A0A7L5E601_9SPHI|nr:DUF6252 family protein [Mucilaginibacter robiniae]QJD97749.1 hypothetical protein HH214_18650 [Mucilaginibacter robiniae]